MPTSRKSSTTPAESKVTAHPAPSKSGSLKPGGRLRLPSDTRQLLLDSAAAEFNERGFAGTDSNRIARQAGFAPQTFYRWFKDKAEVFIEVYHRWQAEEEAVLTELLQASAPDAALADALIVHHRAYLRFRRSLRQLSYEDALVRAARAKSRQRQIAFIRSLGSEVEETAIAAMLLQIERLSDAIAEGEFEDMGVSASAGKAALVALIAVLRSGGKVAS